MREAAGCCQQKGGNDGNQKGRNSPQPAKESQNYYCCKKNKVK